MQIFNKYELDGEKIVSLFKIPIYLQLTLL